MKKFISILLAITLLLSFSSCDNILDIASDRKEDNREDFSDRANNSFRDFLQSMNDKDEEEKTDNYEGETHYNNTEENNSQSEIHPEDNYSKEPVIISATTLNGTVLSASNADSTRSFGAEKAIDKYTDTCWCVNTTDCGIGAQIRFDLSEKSLVRGFMMVNGNLFQPEKNIFKNNGQVMNFTLTFSDGSSKAFTAKYNESASSDYEYFRFGLPVVTDYIILTVDSGYVGQKYTSNVAIGEVSVF